MRLFDAITDRVLRLFGRDVVLVEPDFSDDSPYSTLILIEQLEREQAAARAAQEAKG
jgi:hypothetical protein